MNPPEEKKRQHSQRQKAAEARIVSAPSADGLAVPYEILLHDLQVHQIELEIQNEELRQAQIALEDSRDRYFNLYQFAPVGYLTLTSDGLIAEMNLTGAKLLGTVPGRLLNRRFASLVVYEDRNRWARHFMNVTSGNEQGSVELALTRDDGTIFHAQLDCIGSIGEPSAAGGASAQGTAASAAPGVRIVLSDISGRKQAEAALFDSHETLCSILATTKDGYLHLDAQGGLIDVNAVYSQQSGFTRGELLGMQIEDLESPESAAATLRHIRFVVTTGSGQFESTQRRKDGSTWYAEVSVTYRDVEGGEFFVFLRDITERKRAEEALREQKEFFLLIAENIGDFIAVLDLEGRRLYNSPSYMQFYGATSDLHGTDSFAEIHPDDMERVRAVFRETVRTGIGRQLDYRFVRMDGSIRYMESRGNVIKDGAGQVERVVVVSHDITERKLAEKALKASEAFKSNILNSLAAEIAVVDRDGVIQAVNERWRHFSAENGIEPGKPAAHTDVGSNYLDFCKAGPGSSGDEFQEALDAHNGILAVLDGRSPSFSLEYSCHSPRQQRWFRMIATPLGPDMQHGVVITHADITAGKRAEHYERFRSQILELMTEGEPLPTILEAIVRGVEQLNPGMLCSILLLDSQGRHLLHGAAPRLPDFYNAAIDGIAIGMGVGSCGTAAFTGERVIVEDIATHPYWAPYKELAASADLGACWSQPICTASGQVLGTFAIYHHEAHTPVEADISIIEQSARLASIAIERSHAAEKLRDSEAHYRLLTEDVSDVVWKQDRDNRFTYISQADQRLRGYHADEVIGHHISEILTEEGVAVINEMRRKRSEFERNGAQMGATTVQLQQRCKNGRLIWAEVLSIPERDAHGTITGFHGISRDITERKRAEAELDNVQRLLKETEQIGKLGGWEFHIDTGKLIWTEEIYRIHEVDPSYELTIEKAFDFYSTASRPIVELAMQRAIADGEPYDVELELITAAGSIRCVHVIGRPDFQDRRILGFLQDITERKQMEDRVRQLAFYDPLTELPNRRLLNDRLTQNMAASARSRCYGAVLFIDLDNFKLLNDSHGHEVGDLLLIEVANRLRACVREIDTVARFGGDEFIVLIRELDTDKSESLSQAEIIAEKIRINLSEPYLLRIGHDGTAEVTVDHRCSACVGVVLYVDHEFAQDEILKWADAAMYRAKEAGRDRISFHEPKS